MQKQLLAKSIRTDGKKLTVQQHLLDTKNAALLIFKGRILVNWCRFFKIEDSERFLLHLKIAALFHDIGKANEEFDAAVKKNKAQAIRHEWFSALILHLPEVRNWLGSNKELNLDLEIITGAVLSHHLRAARNKTKKYPKWGKPRTFVKQVQLFLNHPEITNILQEIAIIAEIEGLPANLPQKWSENSSWYQQAYMDTEEAGDDLQDDIEDNSQRCLLLAAIKAGLIASDSVASAMFREDKQLEQWVNDTLHSPVVTAAELEDKILQPRYAQIEKKSEKKFELKDFQKKAEHQTDRLLLLSGCGSGKTIFAYKWFQGVLNRNKVGRIIFLYPTRGTATEGFKDYTSWAPETDATLVTGTAAYELQEIAKNPQDSTEGKDFTADERLFALGFWNKRFFSATVDQFLSFLTHGYGGLCLLPILCDSALVIDEVHSFSTKMFDNLITFLKNFDIPVLCMTATLSQQRQEHLVQAGLEVFPAASNQELQLIEQHPRYDIQLVDYETARKFVVKAYQHHKFRVLWVVNTVKQCRNIAGRREDGTGLESELNIDILTYHSRFKLSDRQRQHAQTVEAFSYESGEPKPAVAVTTQVCEMSLDLDAEVLITELAPISSLVQRFGRSNRHLVRGMQFRSKILVYEPPNIKPYTKEEIQAAKEFIQYIQGENISQAQLSEALEKYSPSEEQPDEDCHFLSGGYWAIPESFRDANDYLKNAILSSDLQIVAKLIEDKKPFDGYVLPVPHKYAHEEWENLPDNIPTYLRVADAQFYCSRRGFGEWKTN